MNKALQLLRGSVFPTLAVCIVCGLWLFYWVWDLGMPNNAAGDAARGQFGDKFGALNTLFTGLALVGLIVTYVQQRSMFFKTAYLNALVYRIEHYSTQIHQRPDAADVYQLIEEQDRLLHELSDSLFVYRKAAGVRELTRAEITERQRARAAVKFMR